jgi:hypothetical protein
MENTPIRIDLTDNQKNRLMRLAHQLRVAKDAVEAAQQAIDILLSTVAECRGASPNARYQLNPENDALILEPQSE